jgi:hypothetical protein
MDLNPKTISWTPPTKYVDGSEFGAADFAGYEFGYRTAGSSEPYTLTVAVPLPFGITSLDLAPLSLPQLRDLDFAMRTVAKNGMVSDWTNPLSIRFDARRPLEPSALRVAA